MVVALSNRHSRTTEGVVNGKSGAKVSPGSYRMMGESHLAALDFGRRYNAQESGRKGCCKIVQTASAQRRVALQLCGS
jgi:hypothetical protein